MVHSCDLPTTQDAQIIIINAPVYFTAIWAIVKPWLAKETAAKVDILGANYQEVLLRDIAPESLPEYLGGICTCADLGGCRMSAAGPWLVGRKERRARWLLENSDDLGTNKHEQDSHVAVAEMEVRKESVLPQPVLVEA